MDYAPNTITMIVLMMTSHVMSSGNLDTPFGHIVGPREFCETETFRASCTENSVIVIQQALYGRMELGRCVRKDLGYIGCHTDVLPLADRRCSGHDTCEIRIPDPQLDSSKPCLEELKTYFEVSYACLSVLPVNRLACDRRRGVPYVINEPHGFLSSLTTIETGCGSESTPYVIQARPGQKVNITLFDFSADYVTLNGPDSGHEPCRKYAIIEEKNSTEPPMVICSGSARVKHVYLSTNHSVEIRILADKEARLLSQFLLKFEVTGCADFDPPPGMWFRRDEHGANVGCTANNDRWKVMCKNKHWQGNIGNCTKAAGIHNTEHSPQTDSLPFGLSMAIILALAFIVSVVVFFIGIISFRRCKKLRQARHMSIPNALPADIELVDDFGRKIPPPKESSKSYPQKQRFRTIKTGHNDYAHIWESTITPGSPQMPACGCHEYQVEYNPQINGATLCRAPPENAACCGMPGIPEEDPYGQHLQHQHQQQQQLAHPQPLKRTDLCGAELTFDPAPPRYYVMDRDAVLADVVFDAERCDVHKTPESIPVAVPEPPSSHVQSMEDGVQQPQQQTAYTPQTATT